MTEQKLVRVKLAEKMEHHHDGRTYRGGDELDLPKDLAEFLCEPVMVEGKRVVKASVVPAAATRRRAGSVWSVEELTKWPARTRSPTNLTCARARK
jgi:hypothetical protein